MEKARSSVPVYDVEANKRIDQHKFLLFFICSFLADIVNFGQKSKFCSINRMVAPSEKMLKLPLNGLNRDDLEVGHQNLTYSSRLKNKLQKGPTLMVIRVIAHTVRLGRFRAHHRKIAAH